MTGDEQLSVNLERLRANLLRLAEIGGDGSGRRVDRPSFSDADMAARAWLSDRMQATGLQTSMDQAGNVCGRWQTGSGPALLLGSHLDSVPAGGIFDGSLGVLAALECVCTLREAGVEPGCPVEVIATSEEEGRFGGMLGAQALAGCVDPDWLAGAEDEQGNRLLDVLRERGFDPARIGEARRDPADVRAFLELHVEQGPVLEHAARPVGIVEGISGVFNWGVTLTGVANHAGTTPMDLRRDAFRGLVDFAHGIPGIIAAEGGPQTRVTIGKVALEPGFAHTVPGRAAFSLIGRDLDEPVMHAVAEACREALVAAAAAHALELHIDDASWLAPSACHPEVVSAFREQAERLGIDYLLMPSGAGHDTQAMTGLTRSGMIFVPSRGGISHSPAEWTDWEHIRTGTTLLLHTLLALTRERR